MKLPTSNRPRRSIYAIAALTLGLGIGWLNLRTTEVTVTILALLTAGLFLGWLQPSAAWRWAGLLVLGLPVMASLALWLGWRTNNDLRM
jgi:hypothetical protein